MFRIKICGITKLEDAQLTAKLGGWAVGFIFVQNSPRYINPELAVKIIQSLPENIEKVGVFANTSLEEIETIVKITGTTKIQLHGNETPEFCIKVKERTGLQVIKAIRIKDETSLYQIKNYKDKVFGILLDTYSEKNLGGSGKTFDWNLAVKAKEFGPPIILAGGLNPDNIKQAYETVKPFALDIASGAEISAGIKSHEKLKRVLLFNDMPAL